MAERELQASNPMDGPIVVAALTYNRPNGLALLLQTLAELELPDPAPRVSVVIVDNSPEGNARGMVESEAEGYPFSLSYAHATERGIAQARNRALDEAHRLGARWLAFIDDDEYPEPTWLAAMMRVAQSANADVVVGALYPAFQAKPPLWLERGGFLKIDAHKDGEPVPIGNTSNVLFDLALAQRHGVRFDTAFALTGGEDTLFFDELKARGAKMVFCHSGVVHETIDPQRNTLRWNARRWIRSGNTDGRIAMLRRPGVKSRFVTVLFGGLARLVIGGGRMVLTSPLIAFGRAHVPAEHLRVTCRGIGFLRAGTGSVMEEYRVHTR